MYPTIQTTRLVLSNISMDDLADIHVLNSCPEVDRYNTLGILASLAETQALVEDRIARNTEEPRKSYILKMQNTDGRFIGMMGLNLGKPNYRNAEVWYRIHPDFWRQGYAREALSAIVHFCFNELNLHRIEAGVATENIASIKVLERCGFLREGHHRQLLPIRGEWVDNYSYAILDMDDRIGETFN